MKKRKWGLIIGLIYIIGQPSWYTSQVMAYSGVPYFSAHQSYTLVKDIDIKWLDYNTTFFVGADMEIEAYIKDDPLNQEILWALNHDGIVDLEGNGHKAKLTAVKEGMVEVAAIVNDGSDSRIHRNLVVSHYPNDEQSQRYLSPGIQPILKVGITNPITQVEVMKEQTSEEKLRALDTYLMKLAKMGTLILEKDETAHELYDYASIRLNEDDTFKVDIRIHKNDGTYETMKKMINQLPHYNSGGSLVEDFPEEEQNTEGPQEPEVENGEPSTKPEEETELIPPVNPEKEESQPSLDTENSTEGQVGEQSSSKPSHEAPFQHVSGVIELDKSSTGSEENPYRFTVDETLTTSEKIQVMKRFLAEMNRRYDVKLMSMRENSRYSIFKFNLSSANVSESILNDFYIELLVDKGDKTYYETIVHMLQSNREQNHDDQETSIPVNKEEAFLFPTPLTEFHEKEHGTEEGNEIPFVKKESFPTYYEWQRTTQVAATVRNKKGPFIYSMPLFISMIIGFFLNMKRKRDDKLV